MFDTQASQRPDILHGANEAKIYMSQFDLANDCLARSGSDMNFDIGKSACNFGEESGQHPNVAGYIVPIVSLLMSLPAIARATEHELSRSLNNRWQRS